MCGAREAAGTHSPNFSFHRFKFTEASGKKLIFILIPIGSLPTKLVLLHNSSKIDFVSFYSEEERRMVVVGGFGGFIHFDDTAYSL